MTDPLADQRTDILSLLLDARDEEGRAMEPQELRDEIPTREEATTLMNDLIAGTIDLALTGGPPVRTCSNCGRGAPPTRWVGESRVTSSG